MDLRKALDQILIQKKANRGIVSELAGINRGTLYGYLHKGHSIRVDALERVLNELGYELTIRRIES